MIAQQRSMYSQAVLDTIMSLDNDASSITGQAENSLNDLKDSSKDDFVVREKLVSLLRNYSSTRNELEKLGGYSFDIDAKGAFLLFTNNVDYGQYIYGRPTGYVTDVGELYKKWFKKYGEGGRGETLKSGDIYGNDSVSAGEDGNDFQPNLNPIDCLKKGNDNTGFISKFDSYKNCYNIIGNGITYKNNDNGVKVDSKKTYSFSYSKTSYSKDDSWEGEIKKGGVIFLLTADSNVMLIAEVESCKAEWVASYNSTSYCSSSYSPTVNHYDYSFSVEFTPIEDIPYYYVKEAYNTQEIVNGQVVTVTKYRDVKKYYDFYPLKRTSASNSIKLKYTQKIQKEIREHLQEFYDDASEEDAQIGYYNWLSTYSTSLNDRNYNIIWNNFNGLKNYLMTRLNICEGVWKDKKIAEKVNELFDERMNKRGGTLKQWYEGAIMADDMEENYKKKLKRKKDVFETLLVQQPAEDFEGGNEMIIDDKCSDYYYKEIGYYPSFNIGDVVYIMDEEKYETRCVILRKDRIQINDTAEVQYETVMRQDGKTEQVAKTDNNGEPITIYTYKNAWKITFNGNVPNMYDPSTVRLVKEI
jgi:hypothetical protein